MGNTPRDRGPSGQWLGFILSGGELSLVGSCPRTLIDLCLAECVSVYKLSQMWVRIWH